MQPKLGKIIELADHPKGVRQRQLRDKSKVNKLTIEIRKLDTDYLVALVRVATDEALKRLSEGGQQDE